MSAVVDSHGHGHAHDYGEHHGGYGGIMRWILMSFLEFHRLRKIRDDSANPKTWTTDQGISRSWSIMLTDQIAFWHRWRKWPCPTGGPRRG